MSLELHRRAEQLMSDADLQRLTGNLSKAAELYALAAEAELAAFKAVPVQRKRTRGIVAISAVLLYDRAGLREQALRAAARLLADDDVLPEFARSELLDFVAAERRRSSEDVSSMLTARLTSSEIEILRSLAMGRSSSEIAGLLHLSSNAVSGQIEQILLKLGAQAEARAVTVATSEAYAAGVVPPGSGVVMGSTAPSTTRELQPV
jgi:DNA-binding NarL/FixJ family response regulator